MFNHVFSAPFALFKSAHHTDVPAPAHGSDGPDPQADAVGHFQVALAAEGGTWPAMHSVLGPMAAVAESYARNLSAIRTACEHVTRS